MENKDILENILTLQKSLVMIYINAVIESSNEKTRKLMLDGMDMALDMQSELYMQMKEDGYYQVTNLNSSDINKTYNKLNKDSQE